MVLKESAINRKPTHFLSQDFQISIEQDEFGEMWTCYCSVNIVPSLENILAIETTLFGIAQKMIVIMKVLVRMGTNKKCRLG
ncbi:hypothetical protein F9Z36_1866 [Neisseria gonorrhoeae]|nr:hypothetical protein F9Z36_1866 [Neisseria gonorrhoeae]